MKRLWNCLMLVCLAVGVEAQQNVCIETSVSECDLAPGIAFAELAPVKVCRNSSVSQCIEINVTPGQVTTTTVQSPDCTESVTTDNDVQPTVVASSWHVQLGSYYASGSGLCAEFTPPKAGSGVIIYELEYSKGAACQGTGPNTLITKVVSLEVVLETGLTVTTQPVNQKVDVGEDVSFTVVAEGSPTSYQWSKDGVPLEDGGNVSGATTATLELSAVTTEDAGVYTVTVGNDCETITSATAGLTVCYFGTLGYHDVVLDGQLIYLSDPHLDENDGALRTFSFAEPKVIAGYILDFVFNRYASTEFRQFVRVYPPALAEVFTSPNYDPAARIDAQKLSSLEGYTDPIYGWTASPNWHWHDEYGWEWGDSENSLHASFFFLNADGYFGWTHTLNMIPKQLESGTAISSADYTFRVSYRDTGPFLEWINRWSLGWLRPIERVFQNGETCTSPPRLPAVKMNPASSVGVPVELELSVPDHPNAVIYYTLDGSHPTRASLQYTEPFDIETKTLVKTFATETAFEDSPVSSGYYGAGCPVPFGLVAWWSGEENLEDRTGQYNGSYGIDYAPYSTEVRIGAPAFTDGKVGKALQSHLPNSGAGRPVFVRDNAGLAFEGMFTIEGWIKPWGNQGVVFSRTDGQETAYALDTFPSPIPNHTEVRFRINSGTVSASATVPINQWTHVAGVLARNGTGYWRLKLFLNGTLANETSSIFGPNSALGEAAAVMIGSGHNGSQAFRGLIDELSVYRRPLSDFEIYQIWFAGTAGKIPGNPVIKLPNYLAFEAMHTTVPEDDPAEFWVAAQGTGLTYSWQREVNGTYTTPTAMAHPFFVIDRAKPSHAGNYRFLVENEQGTITTSEVNLQVNQTPSLKIIQQPNGWIVWEGQDVTFTVKARGTPDDITVRWWKQGDSYPLADYDDDETLNLSAVTTASEGRYRAVVENSVFNGANARVSSWAKLTVRPREAPTITQQPQSQNLLIGDHLVLSVGVVGTPPFTFRWKKGGNLITLNEPWLITTDLNSRVLEFHPIKAENAGTYTVEVENTEGTAASDEAEVTVNIVAPPLDVIVEVTPGTTVARGDPELEVKFKVTALSGLPLSYQWKRDGEILRGETGDWLILKEIEELHEGNYTVDVSNSEGTVTSDPVFLTVTGTGSPSLSEVNELHLPADNGTYTVSLQILKTNSNAANFSFFKVDRVISGTLTIDGDPYDPSGNYSINDYARAVWSPPTEPEHPPRAAFAVRAAHGAEASDAVEVYIRQKPKTRLWAWGNNEYGQLGTGRVSDYRRLELEEDWEVQEDKDIIDSDPRWSFEPDPPGNAYWCYGAVFPPVAVLDLEQAISLRCDMVSVDAVSADGQIWQWGYDWGLLGFGKNVANTDVNGAGEHWRWGIAASGGNLYPYTLLMPSPKIYREPLPLGKSQPFTGIKAIAGGTSLGITGVRLALKEDGTLWSWGGSTLDEGAELGRELVFDANDNAADDEFKFRTGVSTVAYHGLAPRQVTIEGDRDVVEVQSGNGAAIARCADGTLWWWGSMLGSKGEGDGLYNDAEFAGRSESAPWKPVRLTCFDKEDPGEKVKQLSVKDFHYLALTVEGQVLEFGYVPSRDQQGYVAIGMDLFSAFGYPTGDKVAASYLDPQLPKAGGGLTGPDQVDFSIVKPSNDDIVAVAAGDVFGVAITESGDVYAWGHLPPYGADYAGYQPPHKITSLEGIKKVVTGYQCFLALDERGLVWGWGENLYNMFGRSPDDYGWTGENCFVDGVRIQGLENVTDIFCSWWSAYAIGTEELNKPTGLTAQGGDEQVRLGWNAYPGAKGYRVYRATTRADLYSDDAEEFPAAGTEYLDEDVVNGTKYYYAVTAFVANQVETTKSWEVTATPLAPPTEVAFEVHPRECDGVIVRWDAASPATGISPAQEYRILRSTSENGTYRLIATLGANARAYFEETEASYFYKVVAASWAGAADTDGQAPDTETEACLPAPQVPESPYWKSPGIAPAWLSSTAEEGYDELTLYWVGPDPEESAVHWEFQPYELPQGAEFDHLLNTVRGNTWMYDEFDEAHRLVLDNERASQPAKRAALVAALNAFITASHGGGGNPIFGAYEPDPFDGIVLRAATSVLLASSNPNLTQLNRMLLEDLFGSQFAYGPNWGADLTGFRLEYELTERLPRSGQIKERIQHRDVLLKDVKLSGALTLSTAGDPDPVNTPTSGYRYAWRIPSGAKCKVKVAALIGTEVGQFSSLIGPAFPTSFNWQAADLRAVGGYEQVYLQWDYYEQSEKFDLYYKTIESESQPSPVTYPPSLSELMDEEFGWELLAANLRANRFWHEGESVEVTPNIWYQYAVVAYPVDSTAGQVSLPATAQPNEANPPIEDVVFEPEASPYDGMVLVEWKLPRAENDPEMTLEEMQNQTGWQFFVERKPSGQDDTHYQVLTDMMFGLAYLDEDVVNGSSYIYRVTAVDQHYNHYQSVAKLKENGSQETITPDQDQAFALMEPTPGNGYVDLTWSATRANAYTVKHSLEQTGPYEIIANLNTADPFRNPPNTYRHIGVQNGLDHWYLVVATTPTGLEKATEPKKARPLGTLPPLPPTGFKGEQTKVETQRALRLSWNRSEGVGSYQLFIRVNGLWLDTGYTGSLPNYLYSLPAQYQATLSPNESMFIDFAIRGVTREGVVGEFTYQTVEWIEQATPQDVPNTVRLKVAGQFAPPTGSLRFVGPTNLMLSVDGSLSNVKFVNFYSSQAGLIAVADGKTECIWYQVPNGPHDLTAEVHVLDPSDVSGSGPVSAVFKTALVEIKVDVLPELSAFQTAATDLQLPGPGMPITLTRSYNSRSTTKGPSDLAVGWRASWMESSLKLSAPLDWNWVGATVPFLGTALFCVIAEASPHIAAVTLPGGFEVLFQPVILDPPVSNPELYNDGQLDMRFNSFDVGLGELSGIESVFVEDGNSLPTDLGEWDGYPVQLSLTSSQYKYADAAGIEYTFAEDAGDGLTWLLTQIKDRNGNTLTYDYQTDTSTIPVPPAPELTVIESTQGLGSGTETMVQYAWTYNTAAGSSILGGIAAVAGPAVQPEFAVRIYSEVNLDPSVASKTLWRFCYSYHGNGQWLKVGTVGPGVGYLDDLSDEASLIGSDDFTRPDIYIPKKLTSITHSCGRTVWFAYEPSKIKVHDPERGGLAGDPVIEYLFSNDRLTEVKTLVQPSASSPPVAAVYESTKYEYGPATGGNPANANRLTEIYDPRGIRTVVNVYTNGWVDETPVYDGRLVMQTNAIGRVTVFGLTEDSEDINLSVSQLDTDNETVLKTAQVVHDSSGAVEQVWEATMEGDDPPENPTATFEYSKEGRLISQTDADGNAKAYDYTPEGWLNYQADELGHTSTTEYNQYGQPTKITDASDRTTWMSYDDVGNPETVLEPSGVETTYTYYEAVQNEGIYLPKLLKSEIRSAPGVPNKTVTEYEYRKVGEPGGYAGDLVKITEKEIDAEGYVPRRSPVIVTTFEYDANGNRTAENKTRTLFNQTTPETQVIRTEYTYDARNRVVQTVVSEKTGSATEFTPLQTTSVQFDPLGRAAVSKDPYNRQTLSVYDALGNLIETQYPDGTVSRTAYNDEGRPEFVQERAKPVGNATTAPATKTYYDAAGRTLRVERLSGVTLTKSDDTSAAKLSGADEPKKMAMTSAGSVVSGTRTVYDAVGRVKYSVDARGTVTETFYDKAGRRVKSRLYTNPVDAADPLDSEDEIALDEDNDHLDTSYTYDPGGNVLTVTDALNRTTENTYDEVGRLVDVKFPPVGSEEARHRKTGYDTLGRRISETDEANVTTQYGYDFRGLLRSVTLDSGGTPATTTYNYDELGNQISQTDALGRTTKYRYDALGRRTHRYLPGATSLEETVSGDHNHALEKVEYSEVPDPQDANILLQRRDLTDFRGEIIVITNDRMDRVLFKVLPAVNTGESATTNTYVYSDVGLLERVDQRGQVNRTTYYAYDIQRRLERKDTPEGVLAYTYDAFSALQTIKGYRRTAVGVNADPGSATPDVSLSYGYDALGRLQSVQDHKLSETDETTYAYDDVGNLDWYTYPNGVKHDYTYNERNRLKQVEVTRSEPSRLRLYDYTLSPTGQRTRVEDWHLNGSGPARSVAYEYDQDYGEPPSNLPRVNRLTKESLFEGVSTPQGTITHKYDLVGNRISRTAVGVTSVGNAINNQTHTFDDRDQLSMYANSYDHNGNTLRNENDEATDDKYDAENRLIQRGADKFITYDHDGNRVRKTAGATTTLYLVDDRNPSGYAQVLAEYEMTEPSGTSLAGHWRFDETTGTTAGDAAGNNDSGTLINGPEWTAGILGGALKCDGANDYVSVAHSSELQVGGSGADFTVSFWLRLEAGYTGSWRSLMQKGNNNGERTVSLFLRPTENRVHYRISTTANYNEGGDSSGALPVNQWCQVACLKAGNKLRLYFDGVQDSEVTLSGTSVANTGPLYLGKSPWYAGTLARLDDLRIYARALTSTEIAGLTPQLKRRYTYGHDLISVTEVGTSTVTHYYGYDGHGSVRFLTDSDSGAATDITDTYDYDAWGQLLAETGTTFNPYRYTGEQWDNDLGMYYLRARYLNPNTGRFWTMDSYEGSSSDPLTLHKYLYAHADPVNGVDPSGNFALAIGSILDLGLGSLLSNGIRGYWEANRVKIYGGAIAAALAVAGYWAVGEEAQIAMARSAIRAAGKTLDGLIGDAKQIMGLVRNSPVKVIPIPRCIIPAVANHVASAQALGYPGLLTPLTRCNPAQAKVNRAAALAGLGSAFPNSWDEYPFASSWQGGSFTSVAPVPLWQNLVQGGIIAACYKIENITYAPFPTPYFVVVTP